MLLQSIISVLVVLSGRQPVNGQCVDQTGTIKNGMTCAQLSSKDCYDYTFLNSCCQTCKAFYAGVTGCEYGDKVDNCIVGLCSFYADPSECCATCKITTAAPAPSSPTTTKSTAPNLTSAITTQTTPFRATTQQTTSAAAATTTTSNTQTVTSYASPKSSSQVSVPVAPVVSIVSQTSRNITLRITLQAEGTVSLLEINVSTGFTEKIPIAAGNVTVEYIFNNPNYSGTCFTFEIAAISAVGKSATVSYGCYAPLPPVVTIVAQTATNVTLNLTLVPGSLGNTFEVNVTSAGTNQYKSLSLNESISRQYVLDASAKAGTCFLLEIVTIVINNPIKSQATIIPSVCYVPRKPEVHVITQTTSNVTINITLATGSLGNTFEVNVTGGGISRSVSTPIGGSSFIQYVVNEVADAGTCFTLDTYTHVTDNPIKSDAANIINACYAPKSPKMILVTQTASNITLNITLPVASLGNTFEVNVTNGAMVHYVSLPVAGSRFVMYVVNTMMDAGTCFSLGIVTLVHNNPIKSDKTDVTGVCYAPLPPVATIVAQTVTNVTLNLTLVPGSLGNTFEVNVTRAGTNQYKSLSLNGSSSRQYMIDASAEAGTCFHLEIVTIVTNNPIKSQATIIPSVCYVPFKPRGSIIEQDMNYIIFNFSLQAGSTGKSFHVTVIDGKEYYLRIPDGSTYVLFTFNETGIPGTCFTIQVKILSLGNLTESETSSFSNTCYASFPTPPASLSSEEKMIMVVSCVGGLILVCCAVAFCIIVMKTKRAHKKKYSPPRNHRNHRLRLYPYGINPKLPDNVGTYYTRQTHF